MSGGKSGKYTGEGGAAEKSPSRSAKKRESAALQKLGIELTRLAPETRAEMNLPEELLQALEMHDKISDREGARRQRQYIGKIMRTVDSAAIAASLARLKKGNVENVARFHLAEEWRDRLLAAPGADLARLVAELESDSAAAGIMTFAMRAREQNTPEARRSLFRAIAAILSGRSAP